MRRFPNTGKYMLVVAAGLLLAGCCRSNKISISQDVDDIPILLSVKSTGTKAIIDNPDAKKKMIMGSFDANDQNTGGFGVHGYKKVNNQAPFHLFINTRVYPDLVSKPANLEAVEPNTQWTYSPLRFWDLTASYQFLAYWPILPAYDANQSSAFSVSAPDYPATVDDEILTIHNVPNWQPVDGDEIDLMTAVEVGRFSPEFYTGIVPLHFKHMLSQLYIQAYYVGKEIPDNQGGVKIKTITLSEYTPQNGEPNPSGDEETFQVLDNGKTTFTVRYDGQTGSTPSLDDSYQLQGIYTDKLVYKNELSEDPDYLNNFTPTPVGNWLMIPHTWYKQNMIIEFSIGTTDKTSTPVAISLNTAAPGYSTLPGKTYVLTLVFDTTGGGFTVESVGVKEWNEYEIEREVYNW